LLKVKQLLQYLPVTAVPHPCSLFINLLLVKNNRQWICYAAAEKHSVFSERSQTIHQENSDDEDDVYDGQVLKRPGGSVDDFLRGSELGRQQQHYSHPDEYQTESSRGSDLSDILEEDEEELYSEMQHEEGGRRRHSATSHNALKVRHVP
ncbi:RIMS-binding protein 2-like, partial [Chiloscyllium plagiosum]|uniref:RIMS-binding protein 2-like n=1 Tax=Chiloscyllium plagiosum TaxID=36176 RepID=UPI001CB80B20